MVESVNAPLERKILVVDDDEAICELLKTALSDRYGVTTCLNGGEAMKLMEGNDFDLVITDLMLPDATGIEILAYAKSRDEFAEVLMITGHASVDSAAAAINGGGGSYMLKPFSLKELRGRVEKMIAARAFHLKSLQLMNRSDLIDPAVKGHIDDITTLYHFTRNLMLTLEISEVMKITLEEANSKISAEFCSIEINLLGYREVYSMPMTGQASETHLREIFAGQWDEAFMCVDKEGFERGGVPHYLYKGRQGEFRKSPEYKCVNYPLTMTGTAIGSLSVWITPDREIDSRLDQYLHILTSITSPVIGHVYSDLQARFQAKTDGLTGIANHRHFYETLERELARSNRKKNGFALILVDIDNFKSINDTYGHQAGDAVIIELTKHLKANIRAGDMAARYGGEEFCLVLPDTILEGALTLANRVREAIERTPFADAKNEIKYTASFGLAMYDGNAPSSKDELISRADKALYESKNTGKNKVTVG